MPDTGDIIKKLRKEKKLTQEQLGSMIGVQKSAIAKYERGEIVNLKRETIEKLANIFGVRPSYIMGMTDTPAPITEHETKLIDAYRNTDEKTRNVIDIMLDISDN